MSERTIHGLRLPVPEDWDDWSMHRFAPPDAARLPTVAKTARLGANVTVARLVRRAPSLEEHFEAMNAELAAASPGLKVLAGGLIDVGGQRGVYQDLSVTHAGQPVHQRHVLFPGPGASVVLVTFTGDREQVTSMARALGFAF